MWGQVCPSDHWHSADVVEYVGKTEQLFEVQSSNLTMGWDVDYPSKAACREAATSFFHDFLASGAQKVTFR
jgi:hypothetical protein